MKLIVPCGPRARTRESTPERLWWQVRRPHRWTRRGHDRAGNRTYTCRYCGVAGV